MKTLEYSKGTFNHKLGNVITGLAKCVDGLIHILTLGNITSSIAFNFLLYRKGKNFLLNPPKADQWIKN